MLQGILWYMWLPRLGSSNDRISDKERETSGNSRLSFFLCALRALCIISCIQSIGYGSIEVLKPALSSFRLVISSQIYNASSLSFESNLSPPDLSCMYLCSSGDKGWNAHSSIMESIVHSRLGYLPLCYHPDPRSWPVLIPGWSDGQLLNNSWLLRTSLSNSSGLVTTDVSSNAELASNIHHRHALRHRRPCHRRR